MKNGECPKCSCRELYEIEQGLIPNYESSNLLYPLTLTCHYGDTSKTNFLGIAKQGRTVVSVAARVCTRCAYTELYAKDLDVLERFAQSGLGGVRRIKS